MSALLKEDILIDNSLFDLEEIMKGMFVDYITIYQDFEDYAGVIPVFNGGKIINLDMLGNVTVEDLQDTDASSLFKGKVVEFEGCQYNQLWESVKKMQVRGSHDSSIMVFSDGRKVLMMGNVGKWGRIDNVFNLSFWATIEKTREISKKLGLPPFTKGKSSYFEGKTTRHCGAVITRLDVTVNLRTGSAQNARIVLDMLKKRSMKYVKSQILENGVNWGSDVGRNPSKAYGKAQEIVNHLKGKRKEKQQEVLSSLGYITALNEGLVRFEMTLGRKTLSETHLRDIENVTDEKLAMALKKKMDELFQRPDRKISKYNPSAVFTKKCLKHTINSWKLGEDLRDPVNGLSQPTFSRHRREILAISGIDISVPFISDEESFGAVALYQDIELSIAKPPEGYQLEVDLDKAMPDIDLGLPLSEWKQLDASEGVIDFQKYIKQQAQKVADIPDYWSVSSNSLVPKAKVLEDLSTYDFVKASLNKENQRKKAERDRKFNAVKTKEDRKRAYNMGKLYAIHKDNNSHRTGGFNG